MVDSLVFIDSSTSDFNRNERPSDSKIISFDAQSHELLNINKTPHDFVENYLHYDSAKIDKLCLSLSKTWYEDNVTQDFVYDDINLGSMMGFQIHLFLLQHLKKIIGIKNIISTEKPKSIKSSNYLNEICLFFDSENLIKKSKLESLQRNLQKEDKVYLPINFGNKSINLSFSRSTALTVAKLAESMFNNLLKIKFDSSKYQDSNFLFLDISPKPYDVLLETISTKSNKILLNDQGVTSWNLKNSLILKNSNSKISSIYKFNTEETLRKITLSQSKIGKYLDNLLHQIDFNIFSYDGINFWNLIKSDFIKLCKKNFFDAIYDIESSYCFFSNMNIKSIVLLYALNVYEQSILHVAKKFGIPCIRLQHGLDPFTSYWAKYLELAYPSHQDYLYHGLWSKFDKQFLTDYGVIAPDKSVLIGNPRYDKLLQLKQSSNNGTLLLASSFIYTGFDLSGYDVLESENHKKIFEESCRILNNIKDKKLIIKLHPGVIPTYDIQKIVNEINSTIPIFKTQYIFDLLENCEILISMGFSTILLEAMMLGKPTITIMTNPNWFKDDILIKNRITIPVYGSQELKSTIDSILNDKVFKENIIQNGYNFVNSYLENPGNASLALSRFLNDKIISGK